MAGQIRAEIKNTIITTESGKRKDHIKIRQGSVSKTVPSMDLFGSH